MRRILPFCAPWLSSLVLAAIFLTASSACAQTISRDVITANRLLTPDEKESIKAFVESQVKIIGTGSPAEVNAARHVLIQQPKSPGASEVFKGAYSDAVIEALTPIFESPDEFRAQNALQVMPFLFTAEALEALAANSNRSHQRRESVRIAAANLLAESCEKLASPSPDYSLSGGKIEVLARRISDAANEETNWVVLQELGSALQWMSLWRLPAAQAGQLATVRGEQIRTIARMVTVASKSNPEAIRAIHAMLVGLRKQALEIPRDAKPAFAQQLGPVLASINALAAKPPETASSTAKKAFEQAPGLVDQVQKLLRE